MKKEPPPLTRYVADAPAELQQIISKTLRKDRGQRYRSTHELLHALKELRRKLEFKLQRAAAPLWLRWARSPVALVVMLLAAALALTFPFFRHRNLTTSLPPEKSIAVLPLENLSDDKENAFFADGVQDELLSNLSKIKDLKVISRTSVMQYKSGTRRNLKEIAQQLGVSNVVEGSVRRSGDHVRVSVQLVDTRTDRHLWGGKLRSQSGGFGFLCRANWPQRLPRPWAPRSLRRKKLEWRPSLRTILLLTMRISVRGQFPLTGALP